MVAELWYRRAGTEVVLAVCPVHRWTDGDGGCCKPAGHGMAGGSAGSA